MRQPAAKMEIFKPQIPQRAALYERLSRDDGDSSESESIVNQRKILYSFASEMGFEIVGEYVDDGWSGTNFNRPGFQQMLKDIKPKGIDCIITKDLSRLGRDHIMTGYYIENFFPENNIRYIAVNDKVDTEQGDSDIAPFMNVFNEFHAKQTSKKVRSVFEAKFKDGECHYTYPPMGYDKDPDKKNRLVPDPETAWIIQKIFDLADEGKGPWAIRMWLYENRVMTPGYRAYLRWGAYAKTYDNAPESRRYEWGLKNLKEILQNPVYTGVSVHYKKRTISYKNHKIKNQPKHKQMVCKDTHEALISQEKFDRVQERIAIRKRKSKQTNVPHVLAGVAVCADCGGYLRFGANKTSPNHTYNYLCCGRKSEIGTRSCTSHYTNYDLLCEAILQRIQELYKQVQIDKSAIIDRLSVKVQEITVSAQDSQREEREKLEKRKVELENVISKLYEDWASGTITAEIFSAMSGKFRGEHAELVEKLSRLPQEELEEEPSSSGAEQLVGLVEKMSYPTELTAELVNLLIEKIAIHEPIGEKYQKNKPQEIEIFWRFVEPDRSEMFFK